MRSRPQSHNVLTSTEVCAWLQIHSQTLYRLIRHHGFPCFRMGSDYRFNVEQVEQWARDQERALSEKRTRERS